MKFILMVLMCLSFVGVAQAKKMSRKEARATCRAEFPDAAKKEITKCVKKKMR